MKIGLGREVEISDDWRELVQISPGCRDDSSVRFQNQWTNIAQVYLYSASFFWFSWFSNLFSISELIRIFSSRKNFLILKLKYSSTAERHTKGQRIRMINLDMIKKRFTNIVNKMQQKYMNILNRRVCCSRSVVWLFLVRIFSHSKSLQLRRDCSIFLTILQVCENLQFPANTASEKGSQLLKGDAHL